jgi:hypothetical protein
MAIGCPSGILRFPALPAEQRAPQSRPNVTIVSLFQSPKIPSGRTALHAFDWSRVKRRDSGPFAQQRQAIGHGQQTQINP